MAKKSEGKKAPPARKLLDAARKHLDELQAKGLSEQVIKDYETALSGIENGMIYYSLLLPDQPIYHDQHAYLLSIPDLDAFYRALELLVGRHPVLRSSFHLYDFAAPMKVVHRTHRDTAVARDVEDLGGLDPAEQQRQIADYRAADLRHRFAFHGERLWRLKLFRIEESTYLSVWTWHHAILDGWSNLTFWVELNEPHHPCMCYHPDAGWLRAHDMNPEKARSIEIASNSFAKFASDATYAE